MEVFLNDDIALLTRLQNNLAHASDDYASWFEAHTAGQPFARKCSIGWMKKSYDAVLDLSAPKNILNMRALINYYLFDRIDLLSSTRNMQLHGNAKICVFFNATQVFVLARLIKSFTMQSMIMRHRFILQRSWIMHDLKSFNPSSKCSEIARWRLEVQACRHSTCKVNEFTNRRVGCNSHNLNSLKPSSKKLWSSARWQDTRARWKE